jgi:copper homeostasis protein CutC
MVLLEVLLYQHESALNMLREGAQRVVLCSVLDIAAASLPPGFPV